MTPKPKAIIFDLDDTLILSEGAMKETWMKMCEGYAASEPSITASSLYSAIRAVADWFWSDESRHREGRTDLNRARRTIVRGAFEQLGLPNLDQADQLADNYSAKRMDTFQLFPGVHELLADINHRQIPVALLTNGESRIQRAKIDRFNLQPYFTCIRIEGEVGFGKPEKRAYLETLEILGVSPANSWIVGDNLQWEVEVPKSLGIYTIWIDYYQKGNNSQNIEPDQVIHQIEEVRDLIP